MNATAFQAWLSRQGYDEGTVRARVSNCLRVDHYEGNLDRLYHTDQCAALLERLTYTTADERMQKPPLHHIPISGNIRNGTATLKQALRLYILFKESEDHRFALHPPSASGPVCSPTRGIAPLHPPTLDSYAQFLSYFGIDVGDFYRFGLENTVFAEVDKAETQWSALKADLLSNQPLKIRSYGRNGQNSELFLRLYRFLFNNHQIQIDPSNNTAPRANLQKATGHRLY